MVFLAIKNNMSLINALNYYGEIELIIVLCSCISIVLAIPISLYISTYISINCSTENSVILFVNLRSASSVEVIT